MNFEQMLHPVSLDQFWHAFSNKKPLHRVGGAEKPTSFYSWESLEDSIALQQIRPPRLQIYRDGFHIPVSAYCSVDPQRSELQLRSSDIIFLLDQGSTLCMNRMEEADYRIAELAAELVTSFHAPVGVDVIAQARPIPATALQRDYADLLIINIAGKGEWLLYPPRTYLPPRGDNESPQQNIGPPQWQGEVGVGCLLYVPRGWSYRSQLLDTEGLYLRVHISPYTGFTLLEWTLRKLKDYDCFRQDVPFRAPDGAKAEFIGQLKDALCSVLQPNLLDSFLAAQSLKELPLKRPKLCVKMAEKKVSPNGQGEQ